MASGPSLMVSAPTRITGRPASQATDPHAEPRPGASETVASGTLGWRRRIAFHVPVRASVMATSGRLAAVAAPPALVVTFITAAGQSGGAPLDGAVPDAPTGPGPGCASWLTRGPGWWPSGAL